MAAHVNIFLDTTEPAGASVSIDGGATYTTDPEGDVVLAIGTTDSPTTGYTMKIYGDVSDTFATAEYRALEANAPWISFATSKGVRLAAGDGSKTVYVKIRDEVGNATTTAVSDSIIVNTAAPVPSVTAGPTPNRISKVEGFRISSLTWQADDAFDEYKVKVVPATNSTHTAGTQLLTTNGSTNVAGAAGGYPATTGIATTIDGRDLEAASAGDGDKIVKVFVRDTAGNWSA